MSAQSLSSRAIIGSFYDRLEAAPGLNWINAVAMSFNSDQSSETYNWLGMAPAMREWVGGRDLKAFRENGVTIANKHFEASLAVSLDDLRRDKTGQVLVRINDLADRTNDHWASLLSTLILNGAATVCYDGQYFFDTDHLEGASGTQSNSISVDISALAAALHGTVTVPSAEEFQQTFMQAVQAMLGFKDDVGEPLNQNARSFLVMVPVPLWMVANNALRSPVLTSGMTNVVAAMDNMQIAIAANPRLTWTDKFAVFRADGAVKPFIKQEETPVNVSAIAEGSEEEFKNKQHLYGVDAWRNVGYGFWQHAVLATMT